MNYYSFHIGDFRSGAINMSRLTRWIYRDMMDVYYDTEKPLVLDIDKLCHDLGVQGAEERGVVETLLRFKFTKTDQGYVHETCERVIAEYHKKAETAKANGKLGGRPPNPKEPSGFPDGSDQDAIWQAKKSRSKTNQEPITSKPSKPKPSSSSGDDGFAEFWEIYPHKVGKQAARKAWAKIKVTAELLATILAAVEAQKLGQAWRREDGEFIPHPATWLNGGRWLDEVRPYVERVNGDWMRDKEAMEAKGRSLTPPILPIPGDTIGSFKNRILEALEASGKPERRQEPTPYVPPEPAGGVDNLTPEQRRARFQEMKALLAAGKNIGAPSDQQES